MTLSLSTGQVRRGEHVPGRDAMDRRQLINGGLFSGLVATAAPAPAAAAQRSDDRDVAQAVERLTDAVQRTSAISPELVRLREQQRVFLKANQKFPDFIEVGIGVWENVYDWHVRHQQPLSVSRTAEGRYTMTVMLTVLVLRPDQADNYIGFGFDAR
jgi:hypothetical protein